MYFLFFFKTNLCKKIIIMILVATTGTYLNFILLVVSHLNTLWKYFELLPKCQTVTSDLRPHLFNPVMIVILRQNAVTSL